MVEPMVPSEFVALDLETTGLIAEVDRIVEIGAIRFSESGEELGRFQSLINPGCRMPPDARAIHGISDEEVADAPCIADVLPGFVEFLGNSATTSLLAHHASFDAGFLGRELGRASMPLPEFGVIDTLALARSLRPELPTHRLDYLTRVYRLSPDSPHRALGDSMRVKELWLRLKGSELPADRRVTFPIFYPLKQNPAPWGWERLEQAISNGDAIQMEYEGGSRGTSPRTITPRRMVQRGGIVYVVAICHLQNSEKSFRLDRIRCYQVLASGAGENPR